MCGIAGVIGSKASEEIISKMLAVQNHRGPDYTGSYCENNMSLGHNRLSIIDLTSNANQPFISNNKRYVLVFNGEIYNYLELKKDLEKEYQFKTTSDTEVLLAAYIKWGKDCLHKLNGMFSFAIWDVFEEKLFAARDRFGVKPFYYSNQDNTFYFASEIKTLFNAGIEKNYEERVWSNYLVYGSYGQPNETFWKGIEQLPAGHYLEFNNEEIILNKWYCFEKEVQKQVIHTSIEKLKEEYEALLIDSVKLRFRADVPVGFNLSGGVDSSTLLAYVNNLFGKENIEAFTFYCNDKNYDELPWVEEMVCKVNNPLTKVLLDVNKIENLVSEMSYCQDEPYGGIPTIAYGELFKNARSKGIKVLLDGQGMDEQWAGYDYYLKSNAVEIQGVKKSPLRPNVLTEEFKQYATKVNYPKPFKDHLLNLQYRDLFYTKIPRALRFNDRLSMKYSTELREPFLDYRLVELAFAQSKHFKIKGDLQKYVLRDLVKNKLSDSISYAPKRPLQTPQREWLRTEMKEFVNERIHYLMNSTIGAWFDKKTLLNEWELYRKEELDSSFHIWQWLNVSLLIN
ncbi:asparagine synthase (glutamine-hydrolysing) [Lutibacter oricola]|uniref:asparagine synthase (glutamine-hydrolyzing) n=1 Tax=Lutibacter oricola TaxID=762486 RepID=A0A1H2X0R5_9FLAO|nr:asparagine synthase (glutamine-hydrolyzing) [Lutibacter oricola]SDW86435.1 asparagine synthase (glutamine-hydrolysing) [Lutibacter oricola]